MSFAARRKRQRGPIDKREFLVIGNREVPLDEYKREGCGPSMAAVDKMPAPYRKLVHEFNLAPIYPYWRRGTPPDLIRDWIKTGFIKLHG